METNSTSLASQPTLFLKVPHSRYYESDGSEEEPPTGANLRVHFHCTPCSHTPWEGHGLVSPSVLSTGRQGRLGTLTLAQACFRFPDHITCRGVKTSNTGCRIGQRRAWRRLELSPISNPPLLGPAPGRGVRTELAPNKGALMLGDCYFCIDCPQDSRGTATGRAEHSKCHQCLPRGHDRPACLGKAEHPCRGLVKGDAAHTATIRVLGTRKWEEPFWTHTGHKR